MAVYFVFLSLCQPIAGIRIAASDVKGVKMDDRTKRITTEMLAKVDGLEPMIREFALQTEAEARLPDQVADALREGGFYKMFRPQARGGSELDPVSAYKVIEALARIDSAAGWNIAIANASEPFGAWFGDEATELVFGSADSVLAGAFNPPRRAVPTEGGYLLSGQTNFNSNCHAANWVLGLAQVYDGETPRVNEDGEPEILITLFPTGGAKIISNWNTLGMRGTGSHDLCVESLFVPSARAVQFHPLTTTSSAYQGPLHRMAVWAAIACNAVTALGVAQAAIDAFVDLANKKTPAYTATTLRDRSVVQLRLAQAVARLESARVYFHHSYDQAWQVAVAGQSPTLEDRAILQLASSNAVSASAEAVDLVHSIVGTSGIRNELGFQRFFRDVHVITQHAYVCETRLEAVGQILLGLEPDWGFFHFA